MFPLPGVFLFPGQILPLHVFEPRYRQMIRDLLDSTGRLVMGTIVEGSTDQETPPVLPIGGLGEITQHEKLPDGRFMVLLFGLCRVRIEEVESEALYRKIRYEPLLERLPEPCDSGALQSSLVGAIIERSGIPKTQLDDVETPQLVDILAQCLRVPQAMMERIYAETDVTVRARTALAAHVDFPHVRPEDDSS